MSTLHDYDSLGRYVSPLSSDTDFRIRQIDYERRRELEYQSEKLKKQREVEAARNDMLGTHPIQSERLSFCGFDVNFFNRLLTDKARFSYFNDYFNIFNRPIIYKNSLVEFINCGANINKTDNGYFITLFGKDLTFQRNRAYYICLDELQPFLNKNLVVVNKTNHQKELVSTSSTNSIVDTINQTSELILNKERNLKVLDEYIENIKPIEINLLQSNNNLL